MYGSRGQPQYPPKPCLRTVFLMPEPATDHRQPPTERQAFSADRPSAGGPGSVV
jgi:hypothetical protein